MTDGGVLSGLHHFVEVTDRALAHRPGQRSVDPDRFAALEQEPPHQIRRRHVLMARDGDQVTAEFVGHGLDEAGLPAPRRSFEQHRQTAAGGRAKHLHLVVDRAVERRIGEFVDGDGLAVEHVTCSVRSERLRAA